MAAPIEPLVQFVNHGILPFAGRDSERREILAFSAGLATAESLRIGLVTGEGGIGKSRLFEETLPGIIAQGGCIVRAKLHADTAGSLVALLVDSLWRSEATRSIIKRQPEPTVASVLHQLRRLVHLRQLIVVIEDIHLLTGPSVDAFAALVAGLADEPAGMLLAARPVALDVRGIIEPHIGLNLELVGLNNEALETIWSELFGVENMDKGVMKALLERTEGNPLAMRMALRTGVRSESVDSPKRDNLVRLVLDLPTLERSLHATTRLLAEGMIAHLDTEERSWAARLASLGEIVSPEAAQLILDGNQKSVQALLDKGVIAESVTIPAALTESTGERSFPLVFTHTLVHRYFLEKNEFDIDRFWGVLAAKVTLYSLTPFERIASGADAPRCAESTLLAGANAFRSIMSHLNMIHAPGSHSIRIMVEGFDRIISSLIPDLSKEAALELELINYYIRINRFRYAGRHDTPERRQEYVALLEGYLDRAVETLPEHLLHHRIWGLAWSFTFKAFTDAVIDHELSDRIEKIIEAHPEFRKKDRAYFSYHSWVLRYVLFFITENSQANERLMAMMALSRDRMREILNDDSGGLQSTVDRVILPIQMHLFGTADELEECRKLFTGYEMRARENWDFRLHALKFLVRTGNIERALQQNNDAFQGVLSGKPFPSFDYYWSLPLILSAVNTPLPEISEFMRKNWQRMDPAYYPGMAHNLHLCGALRGDAGWGDDLFRELTGNVEYVEEQFAESLFYWFVQGTLRKKHDKARELLTEHRASGDNAAIEVTRFNHGNLTNLAYFVFGLPDTPDETSIESAIRSELLDPLCDCYRFDDLISTLTLLSYAESEGISSMRDRLCPDIRLAIIRTMNWLIETRRIVFARIFPEHFPECFTQQEWKEWSGRIDIELEEQRKRLRPDDVDVNNGDNRRVGISMIGSIGYRMGLDGRLGSEDSFQAIKGIRLKQLLGLMTLSAIVERPLSRAEFFAVVADDGADDESRRNAVKVAVYQLRKLLGPQSIQQGDETPRLNLEVVRVDLIEACQAIARAESEFGSGSLKNAATALLRALHILNSEVAYPTLYDQTFESAREDLETRLRRIILNVSRRLLAQGDESTCEAILRQGVRQISGDEEIEEELLLVLGVTEKRLDAVRMRGAVDITSVAS